MKKPLALALALVLALSLAACGGNSTPPVNSPSDTNRPSSTPVNTPANNPSENNDATSSPENNDTALEGEGWPSYLLPGVPEYKMDMGISYYPYAGGVIEVLLMGSSMSNMFNYIELLHQDGWDSNIADDLTLDAMKARFDDNFNQFGIWNDKWEIDITKRSDTNFTMSFREK